MDGDGVFGPPLLFLHMPGIPSSQAKMNDVGRYVKPQLLHEEAAEGFMDRIESSTTRQLIEIPYSEVLRRFSESDRLPSADFDLAFFVEGLFLSCSCQDRIRSILAGGDLRWFPEEDDDRKNASYCPLPVREPASRISLDSFTIYPLVRWHEARWLTSWLGDTVSINIVGIALAAFWRHFYGRPFPPEPRQPQGCPLAPVDMLFCAEVLFLLADDRKALRSILSHE